MNTHVISVDRLVDALKRDGLIREADSVNRLVYERVWTVSSELWGELGLELKRIMANCGPLLSNVTIACFNEVIQDIHRVWPEMEF
jgi:hypothetical protein